MKKNNRKARLEALRKAYYVELNKAGVMDSEPVEEATEKPVKKTRKKKEEK